MSKALVLRDVDFDTNAVAQVTIIDPIPCTGISLDHNTVSLTNLSPYTLTASVVPSSTTDVLVWSTSDSTIATVLNGVVTPLRAGTVTITATCGSRSASCEFTIVVILNAYLIANYYYSPKNTGGLIDTIQMAGDDTTTSYGCSCRVEGTGYHAYGDSDKLGENIHSYPIMIPNGATSIMVTVPDQNMKCSFAWCDSSQVSGYEYGSIKCNSCEGNPWATAIPAGNRTVAIPSGITTDCFYISFYRKASTYGDITQEVMNQVVVQALYD